MNLLVGLLALVAAALVAVAGALAVAVATRSRPPSGTGAIRVAFALSVAGSVGFAVTYVLGGQPQIEAVTLALALGGIGVGLVLWVRRFGPSEPVAHEIEPLAPARAEREALAEELGRGEDVLPRRGFLGKLLFAALAALGLAALVPLASLGPKPGRALVSTAWRAGARLVTEDGTPIAVADLDPGAAVTVFPEGRTEASDSQTLLIRLRPGDRLQPPTRTGWAPAGHVAYSQLCTHAACPVNLYERRSNLLLCPCHQSLFDVLEGARPLGGPATRPLPQLPLAVDEEGFLVADGDYPEPVGAAFWNMP